MFLINLNYTKDITEVEKYTDKHRAWLDTLYAQEKLLFSGPLIPRNGGIIITLIKDKDKVEKMIQEDPFYINQIATYDIKEFNPVKFHPAVKNLMETNL